MKRSKYIFQYFNSLCKDCCLFDFIETENKNMDENVLIERQEREESSCLQFKKNIISRISNWKDFTIWFYTHHDAYKSIIKYKNNEKINKSY